VRHAVRLPKGWDVAEVGELGDVVTGSTPSTKQSTFYGGHIPFVRPQELLGSPIASTETTLTEEGAASGRVVPEGSVLVGCIGTLGKTGITTVSSAFNQQINAVVPGTACTSKWLLYGVQSPGFKRQMLDNSSATTVAIINKGRFSLLKLPIAPIEEQHRIVEAIESYLTRLDDAVASLERVQRNLERYRASVLKAAVEGRLVPTEAELARKEGRSYEPASELLKRILAERKTRWIEDAVEKARAKGVTDEAALLQARKQAEKKYKEPEPPDLSALRAQAGTSDLPTLPEGWCWTTVEQVTAGDRKCSYGVLVPGPDVPDGVPFVRVGDITGGRIHLASMKHIAREIADRFAKTYLQGGEVLLTLVGTIGRTAVVPANLAGANVARAVGVIPTTPASNPYWVEVWFRNPEQIRKMEAKSHEVARKTLNLEDVRTAAIALPPDREQVRIVEALQDSDSIVRNMETQISRARARCNHLRQSILKWAFEGKLVEQDPNDEPASVLLERIKMPRTIENGGRRAR